MSRPHSYLLLISLLPTAWALPSDRLQTAHITADYMDVKYKQGISIYRGHVRMDQGSTHLSGETITVYHGKDNNIIKAIAKGSPAHYHTRPEPKKALMHAQAKTIQYLAKQQRVLLSGEARATQADNSFQAPFMVYNIEEQSIASTPRGNRRTTITIKPHTPGDKS